MPSSAISNTEEFFALEDLTQFVKSMDLSVPVIKGRVWGGDERSQSWSVECESFADFKTAVAGVRARLDFLAFDVMSLDEDTLHLLQEDLYRYSEEQNVGQEVVSKGLSALRSHENEVYAVVAYAFLSSGRVLFARAQNELARFVYHPERLLSNEGLSTVRKLKTLAES